MHRVTRGAAEFPDFGAVELRIGPDAINIEAMPVDGPVATAFAIEGDLPVFHRGRFIDGRMVVGELFGDGGIVAGVARDDELHDHREAPFAEGILHRKIPQYHLSAGFVPREIDDEVKALRRGNSDRRTGPGSGE